MRNVRVLEISFNRDVEVAFRNRAELRTNHLVDLLRRPHEELSFLALAVRVLRGVEAAFGTGHLAQNVIENLARDA